MGHRVMVIAPWVRRPRGRRVELAACSASSQDHARPEVDIHELEDSPGGSRAGRGHGRLASEWRALGGWASHDPRTLFPATADRRGSCCASTRRICNSKETGPSASGRTSSPQSCNGLATPGARLGSGLWPVDHGGGRTRSASSRTNDGWKPRASVKSCHGHRRAVSPLVLLPVLDAIVTTTWLGLLRCVRASSRAAARSEAAREVLFFWRRKLERSATTSSSYAYRTQGSRQ